MENVVDPAGRELLDVLVLADDGRLEDALVDVVLPGLLAVVDDVDFVSVDLLAADTLPVDVLADDPAPDVALEAVDGRVEL